MKKKKLSKIVKLTLEELRNSEKLGHIPVELKSDNRDYDLSEYNKDVSEKFKKMINNILTYKENLNIHINDDRITIYCENAKNLKSNSVTYKEENHLEISIHKSVGFYINYGHKKMSKYKDQNMFEEVLNSIIEKQKEINYKNFNNLWSTLMIDTGVSRDNNLDTILGD